MENKIIKTVVILLIIISSCNRRTDIQYVIKGSDTIYYEHYPSGSSKVMTYVKNGKFNGQYESYNKDGHLVETGLEIVNK